MSLPVSEKLILRQINHWSNLRAKLNHSEFSPPTQRKPVITISRLAGSGGRSLACDLTSRLSLDLQDQSMVQRIVKDRNLEKSLVKELDENTISQTRLWVKGILNQRIFMKDQYHRDLVRVVSKLAARGGVVFLGRGANLILGDEADLRVRIVASKRTRIPNLRKRLDLSLAEARILVEETDAKRRDFVRQVFRQEPGQGENYDLVLNADRLSLESMSALVVHTLMECSVMPKKNQMVSQE